MRSYQVAENFVSVPDRPIGRPTVLQEMPQTRAHEGRQRGFEVLEGRAPQILIPGQEPSIRDLQRLGGLHKGQERKDVRQPLVGPILDELVFEGAIARVIASTLE